MDLSVSSIGHHSNKEAGISSTNGPKYVNVRNRDVFLISVLYSKMSLLFLCLIGLSAAINTGLFINQLRKSEPLCMFNNYLPYGNTEVREMSMPIVYYCRFLEFSVPITFLQLILCIAALIFGLNRKSMLFFASYCFLWMLLFHGAIFFTFLFFLNYEYILKSVFDSLIKYVINEDQLFCLAMEPFLHCKFPNETTSDVIADICDTKRQHHDFLHKNCHEYMTAYLVHRGWLLAVALEYCLVIIVGIYATTRAIIKFRNRKTQKIVKEPYQRPHSASAVVNVTTRLIKSSVSDDLDSAATL